MRIAVDATAVPRLPAGAAVYTIELLRALAAADRANEYVVFVRGGGLDDLPSTNPSFRLRRVRVPTRPLRLAWEQGVLPRILAGLQVDVLHSPHHTTPCAATAFAASSRSTT